VQPACKYCVPWSETQPPKPVKKFWKLLKPSGVHLLGQTQRDWTRERDKEGILDIVVIGERG